MKKERTRQLRAIQDRLRVLRPVTGLPQIMLTAPSYAIAVCEAIRGTCIHTTFTHI